MELGDHLIMLAYSTPPSGSELTAELLTGDLQEFLHPETIIWPGSAQAGLGSAPPVGHLLHPRCLTPSQ